MKENVGKVDRIARSIIGPSLMALGYARWGGRDGKLGGLTAIVSGALLVESAVTRVCPINGWLGIDSRNAAEIERDLRETIAIYIRDSDASPTGIRYIESAFNSLGA